MCSCSARVSCFQPYELSPRLPGKSNQKAKPSILLFFFYFVSISDHVYSIFYFFILSKYAILPSIYFGYNKLLINILFPLQMMPQI